MSARLDPAELAAIRVEVNTNAHPREPETRYILTLLAHAAALERLLDEQAEQLTDAQKAARSCEKELDYLRGQLVLERDAAAVVLRERDAELAELRAIVAGQVTQIAHLTEQRTTLRRANGELTALLVAERDGVAAKAATATAEG